MNGNDEDLKSLIPKFCVKSLYKKAQQMQTLTTSFKSKLFSGLLCLTTILSNSIKIFVREYLTNCSIACWASRNNAFVFFRSCLYRFPELSCSFKCSTSRRRSINLRSDSFLAFTACETSWCSSSNWASSVLTCGKQEKSWILNFKSNTADSYDSYFCYLSNIIRF